MGVLFCCSWLGKNRIPRVLVGGKILCGCLLGKSWGKSWGFWLVGEVSKLDVLVGKVVAGFCQFISKKSLGLLRIFVGGPTCWGVEDFSAARWGRRRHQVIGVINITSWWLNQSPLKNMLVKMGSSSPRFGLKIKNVWNHHLDDNTPPEV